MSSYITMEASQIADLASKCIKRIKDKRAEMLANQVARVREQHKRSWLVRFFNMAVPSDDQILQELHDSKGCFISQADFIQMYAEDLEVVAERLLTAAQYGRPIKVSTDDLARIS